LNDAGNGQVVDEFWSHPDRTASRTAAAVGRGKGFVKIELDHIKAQIARPGFAHEGVGVCAVAVKESPPAVHNSGDLPDIPFEKPERIWIRQHEPGDISGHQFPKMRDVDASLGIGANGYGLEAAQGAGRGIGAVGGIGDQNLAALVPPHLKVFFHHHHAGQFAVGPRGRLEGEVGHAEDLAQVLPEFVHQPKASLRECNGPAGMQRGKAGPLGDLLVNLRVVLHGAGAQRIEADVDAEIPPRKGRVMPDQIDFRHLRKIDILPKKGSVHHLFEFDFRNIAGGYAPRCPTGPALLKDEFHGQSFLTLAPGNKWIRNDTDHISRIIRVMHLFCCGSFVSGRALESDKFSVI